MLEAETEKNRVWGSAGKSETLAEGANTLAAYTPFLANFAVGQSAG